MSSVLYDAPGPRAKLRNKILTVLFVILLALVAWWVWLKMDDKGQLEWSLWEPFTTSQAWTTYLLPGLADTLKAAGLAMVISLPLGALFGIARLSDHTWVRVPAGVVVEFFRSIPVLLLMLFANEVFARSTDVSTEDRPMFAVVTGLVLYNASVLAEVVRAGILALPKGQTEAAQAIGLRKGQTMSTILLPQAVTVMLPAIVSQLVVIVKDTALGGVMLQFTDLLNARSTLAANYGNVVQSFVVVAIIYIIVNFIITSFAGWLEQRLRRGKKSTGAVMPTAAVGGTTATGGEGGGAPGLGTYVEKRDT
ncbi:amino acid ABC transporter permease [Streptomyces heilongjiangensis]|uniref:Amino acid ABC transporter permease n=1 Tax=Streptomyces heilongjiangensis TaxID=945052 RepID=A0ABW1BBK9_9ACTN|nr:amino acid ABC transporter permease [Streptomyces heilongjiangensis]MDC2948944.1 amino acid ABC transporter permease [Streptomyces heilongjiangensis]